MGNSEHSSIQFRWDNDTTRQPNASTARPRERLLTGHPLDQCGNALTSRPSIHLSGGALRKLWGGQRSSCCMPPLHLACPHTRRGNLRRTMLPNLEFWNIEITRDWQFVSKCNIKQCLSHKSVACYAFSVLGNKSHGNSSNWWIFLKTIIHLSGGTKFAGLPEGHLI